MSSFPLLTRILKRHYERGGYGGKYIRMSAATLTAIKAMNNDLDMIKRVNSLPIGSATLFPVFGFGIDIRLDETLRFGEWELRDKHDDSIAESEMEPPVEEQP